ncbi:MAG: hypothetical protein A2Z27_03890 [candidate division Zixibacteria bacterium RBG_16_50_21]|nr:MAG: hypothetical protein A2Z27_03890 [candidate division Zixibacteria bacterium RBG_16_50_21]
MKVSVKNWLLALLAAIVLTPTLWASNSGEMDCPRVRAAFGLTNQVLRVTGNWLQECDLVRAESLFQHALRLQHRAQHLLSHEHCRLALEHTQAARGHAYQAVILCFGVEGFCYRTGEAVFRTGKAIGFLDSLIRECDIPEAKRLFLEGVEHERKAVEAQRNNHCREALELTLISRKLIFTAARLCNCEGTLSASFPEMTESANDNYHEADQISATDSPALLEQNSPNPFNAQTTIFYSLPGDAQVKLVIYNVRGQRVRTLVDEYQAAGEKQVIWDGTNLNSDKVASGIYFYRLEVNGTGEVKRMVFLK